MCEMEKILIAIGLLIVQFSSNNIINWTVVSIFILYGIYDFIKNMTFSKKVFGCLICGHEFKPKWYKLWLGNWRYASKYREYKKIDTGEYEKIKYKCPACKSRECVIK